MRTKLLQIIAILFLLSTWSAVGQITVFNANFSNGAGTNNWADVNTSGNWTRGTDVVAFGAGSYKYIQRTANASTNYPHNANASTTSPTINLTGYERLKLTVRVNYKTQSAVDGMRIMFSTDNGTTYYPLGKENDDAAGWYNSTNIVVLGANARGWSGNSGGWVNASIDLPSQGFDNKNNIRFKVEFKSDGATRDIGVAFDDFIITGYAITAKPYTSCVTGIGDKHELWLKPDNLSALANNSPVSLWPNATGINPAWTNATAAATSSPIYKNNATDNVNFNPVVSFDGTKFMSGKQGFYNADIFIVVKPKTPIYYTTPTQDIFLGDDYLEIAASQDVTGLSINNTSARYGASPDIAAYNQGSQGSYGRAIISNTIAYDRPVIFNARLNAAGNGMDLFLDGVNLGVTLSPALISEVNVATFKNILNSRYWIGKSEYFGPSFEGDILEIMIYSDRKTDIDRKKVESYLGIKYGITLGLFPVAAIGLPHVPGQYVDSAGTSLWNAAMHPGFTYNVAGIGRDDCYTLNQKQAKSIDPNTFITVGLGDIYTTNASNTNTFANDRDYLIWGSTLSTLTTMASPLSVNLGPSLVTTFTDVTQRTWKFVEKTTTNIGTVKISVSTSGLTALPALTGNDAYVMIIADDANFTTNIETVFLNTNGTNQECQYDFDGTKYVKFGVAHEVIAPRHMSFDGTDDYVKIGNKLNQTGAFSVSAWIYANGANATVSDRTIISKRGSTNVGYHFLLGTNNKITMRFDNVAAAQITSNTVLNDKQWRNVTFTYDGTVGKLYIDGVLDNSKNMSAPAVNTNEFCIGARYVDKTTILNNFSGNLDEIRIWNSPLTQTEIRFIMNQEIENFGGNIKGLIIPATVTKNDIIGKTWNNLNAYFNMNTYIGTHLNDASGKGNRGSLITSSTFNIQNQTAPLPYVTAANDFWMNGTAWKNGSDMYIPNSELTINGVLTKIDWNIVETSHDIMSEDNKILLGLKVNSNTLKVQKDSKMEVSHYLKIDGKIDLEGRSQLIQTFNSDLDPASSGILEKDQQGASNKFNYNYWCSPVGPQNAVTNNNNYTVGGVLKDGTDAANPANINWIAGYNGIAGSPISLARYWIYKFQNVGLAYANWTQILETGSLAPSQGFTLKGTGSLAPSQNYTFVGKPNNGKITNPIAANFSNLSGNPYPSAIDADAFINDNSTAIKGTLYFWEHYSTNNSHNLAQYQGGYASRNLTGGVAPVKPAGISGLGSSSRIPGRYIPVGQAFFIQGNATGGTIKFDNNQRIFIKEDNINSNVMFKNAEITRATTTSNEDDVVPEGHYAKIRLGYTTHNNYHRQVLLGFMNENATPEIDYGYDGELNETLPTDMYFRIADKNFVIQGDGFFNASNVYPIGIKTNALGTIKFMIDALENFDDNQPIFIHDNLTNTFHNIRNGMYEVQVPVGENNNRFTLCFSEKMLSTDQHSLNEINVIYAQNGSTLQINNGLTDVTVQKVALYSILGQLIETWNVADETQESISIPIENISTGTYIVKMETNNGSLGKKIIIK